MRRSSGRARSLGWLAAFVVLPVSTWVTAARDNGFEGKSLSNLSLEPMVVAVSSCVVFGVWHVVSRGRLNFLAGVILLIVLSACAIAVQHFVPGLRE